MINRKEAVKGANNSKNSLKNVVKGKYLLREKSHQKIYIEQLRRYNDFSSENVSGGFLSHGTNNL